MLKKEANMWKKIILRREEGIEGSERITVEEFIEDLGDAFNNPGVVAENLLLNDSAVSVGTRVYHAA